MLRSATFVFLFPLFGFFVEILGSLFLDVVVAVIVDVLVVVVDVLVAVVDVIVVVAVAVDVVILVVVAPASLVVSGSFS